MQDDKTLGVLGGADLSKTDHELGEWLVASWLGYQAEKAGFSLERIPEAWATSLIEATAAIDSESVKNAPLESAFRKACAGNYESAGRVLRDYMLHEAESMVAIKYARKGLQRMAINSKAGKATAKVKKQKAGEWHAEAVKKAKTLIAAGRKSHEVTAIVAQRIGRPAQKVRPVLQAAGIVLKRKKNAR